MFGYFTNKQKKMGKVRADIPAMLGHKTAVWYAWEHRERRGRGGGHKEEVLLLKRFVAEKIRCEMIDALKSFGTAGFDARQLSPAAVRCRHR